jgi:hypothetical protein
MRSPQTGVRARAPRPPPVELDAEGQTLRERLYAFRLKRVVHYLVLNAQLTSSGVLMRHFKCCRGNDNEGKSE